MFPLIRRSLPSQWYSGPRPHLSSGPPPPPPPLPDPPRPDLRSGPRPPRPQFRPPPAPTSVPDPARPDLSGVVDRYRPVVTVDDGLAQRHVPQAVQARGGRRAAGDNAVVERDQFVLEPALVPGDLLGPPGAARAAGPAFDLERGRLVAQERRGKGQPQSPVRRVQRELHPVPRDAGQVDPVDGHRQVAEP